MRGGGPGRTGRWFPIRSCAGSSPVRGQALRELDSVGARSVLRRYSDAWFAAAKRRREGDQRARFPRRRRALMPVRWSRGAFTLTGRQLRLPVARGRPPLWVRLDRDLPYPTEQVRSVTLLYDAGRLWIDVTAEIPVASYRAGHGQTRPDWRGSILESSTRTRWPGPGARRCWCRGGRSVPSTGCTWPTARAAAGQSSAAPQARAEGSRRWRHSAAASGSWKRGTVGGSARPSTKPPRWSSPGPLTGGRHPGVGDPAASELIRAAAQPAHPRLADRPPDRRPERQGRGRRDRLDPGG